MVERGAETWCGKFWLFQDWIWWRFLLFFWISIDFSVNLTTDNKPTIYSRFLTSALVNSKQCRWNSCFHRIRCYFVFKTFICMVIWLCLSTKYHSNKLFVKILNEETFSQIAFWHQSKLYVWYIFDTIKIMSFC